MYLSMAKLMGGSFCSNDFKAIKRQLRSVFTSTFSLDDPTPREPAMNQLSIRLELSLRNHIELLVPYTINMYTHTILP